MALIKLAKRGQTLSKLTEYDMLVYLAQREEVSEHEIFIRASRVWNKTERSADKAFEKFLFTEEMPYWVKQYVRQFY